MSMFRSLLFGGNQPIPVDEHTILLLHAEDFIDSSNNGLSVSNANISINDNGKFNKCFYNPSLSGANNYVSVALPNNLGNIFTIDFWLKPTNYGSGNGVPLTVGDYNSGVYFQFENSGARMYLWAFNQGYNIGSISTKIPLNQWTHIAVVATGSRLTLYFNGTQEYTRAETHSIARNDLSIFCSRASITIGRPITGYIDEVRISDVARWDGNFTPPTEPY